MRVVTTGVGQYHTIGSIVTSVTSKGSIYVRYLGYGNHHTDVKDIRCNSEVWATKPDDIAYHLGVNSLVTGCTFSKPDGSEFHVNPCLQVKAQCKLNSVWNVDPALIRTKDPNELFDDNRKETMLQTVGDEICKRFDPGNGRTRIVLSKCVETQGCVVGCFGLALQEGGYAYVTSVHYYMYQESGNTFRNYMQVYSDRQYRVISDDALENVLYSYVEKNLPKAIPYLLSQPFKPLGSVEEYEAIAPYIPKEKIEAVVGAQIDALSHELTNRSKNFSTNSLSYEALQNLGLFSGNGIQYLKDIADLGNSFKSFGNLLKKLPKRRVKDAAQTYLSCHYGWRLSYLDTVDVIKKSVEKLDYFVNLRRLGSQYSEMVRNGVTHTARYHIYYDDRPFWDDWVAALATKYDLSLSAENLWDMVPYSFVIDWFIGIGDMLNAYHNMYTIRSRYNILGTCRSDKVTGQYDLHELDKTLRGTMTVTAYLRSGRSSLVTPIPTSQQLLPSSSPLCHFVEGAALIVSR